MTGAGGGRIRIWDLPTRLFHWLVAVLIAASWGTAEYDRLDLHRWSGYAILVLLLFRIAWGFVGSETARFSRFVRGPAAILTYARGLFARKGAEAIGHNPIGALSVLALLAVLIVQTVLGLFAIDVDMVESGPLTHLVSYQTGRRAAKLHAANFDLLLVLIALHLAAIAFYALYKRQNLVWPMVTGHRRVEGTTATPPRAAPLARAALVLALTGALVWVVVTRV